MKLTCCVYYLLVQTPYHTQLLRKNVLLIWHNEGGLTDKALATVPEWLTLQLPLPTVGSLEQSLSFKLSGSTWCAFRPECSLLSTF